MEKETLVGIVSMAVIGGFVLATGFGLILGLFDFIKTRIQTGKWDTSVFDKYNQID